MWALLSVWHGRKCVSGQTVRKGPRWAGRVRMDMLNNSSHTCFMLRCLYRPVERPEHHTILAVGVAPGQVGRATLMMYVCSMHHLSLSPHPAPSPSAFMVTPTTPCGVHARPSWPPGVAEARWPPRSCVTAPLGIGTEQDHRSSRFCFTGWMVVFGDLLRGQGWGGTGARA